MSTAVKHVIYNIVSLCAYKCLETAAKILIIVTAVSSFVTSQVVGRISAGKTN